MKISHHCYAVLGLGYFPLWTVNSDFICGLKNTLIIDSHLNHLSSHTSFGYTSSVNPSNKIILVNTEKHLGNLGAIRFIKNKV